MSFCPESELSGIGDLDFMAAVWYRRSFTLTKTQSAGRAELHFGAVDYLATVAMNGGICGSHKGGYVSFSFDITDLIHPGENVVTVRARDNSRDPMIPTASRATATPFMTAPTRKSGRGILGQGRGFSRTEQSGALSRRRGHGIIKKKGTFPTKKGRRPCPAASTFACSIPWKRCF